jgi:uncharacterized protein
MSATGSNCSALAQVLRTVEKPAIAVSGGVDSVTLAALAFEALRDVEIVHAVSPAVPPEATARVRALAELRGWPLTVLSAGEFDDPKYRANPIDRCLHCKSNLYRTIRSLTSRQILSGANTDDLGEYRPGLEAARSFGVRHPYIEADVDKRTIRRLARELGLDEVADLPASPCLSSRVETGIPIEPVALAFIHRVERTLGLRLNPTTVRCRIRASALAIELDGATLSKLGESDKARLREIIAAEPQGPRGLPILFEPYRNGSAFVAKGARN